MQDHKKLKETFIITYNGTLYNSQPIEPFLEVTKRLILKYQNKIKILLKFPGLDFDPEQSKRVYDIMKDLQIILKSLIELKDLK